MAFHFESSGVLKKMTPEELAAADADSVIILFEHGTSDDGRPYWAYIEVKPSQYEKYMRLVQSGNAELLESCSTVIRFGYDAEVPAAIKEEMRQKYGCDDQYLAKLEKEVRAAQTTFMEGQENKRLGDIVAMLKKKQG